MSTIDMKSPFTTLVGMSIQTIVAVIFASHSSFADNTLGTISLTPSEPEPSPHLTTTLKDHPHSGSPDITLNDMLASHCQNGRLWGLSRTGNRIAPFQSDLELTPYFDSSGRTGAIALSGFAIPSGLILDLQHIPERVALIESGKIYSIPTKQTGAHAQIQVKRTVEGELVLEGTYSDHQNIMFDFSCTYGRSEKISDEVKSKRTRLTQADLIHSKPELVLTDRTALRSLDRSARTFQGRTQDGSARDVTRLGIPSSMTWEEAKQHFLGLESALQNEKSVHGKEHEYSYIVLNTDFSNVPENLFDQKDPHVAIILGPDFKFEGSFDKFKQFTIQSAGPIIDLTRNSPFAPGRKPGFDGKFPIAPISFETPLETDGAGRRAPPRPDFGENKNTWSKIFKPEAPPSPPSPTASAPPPSTPPPPSHAPSSPPPESPPPKAIAKTPQPPSTQSKTSELPRSSNSSLHVHRSPDKKLSQAEVRAPLPARPKTPPVNHATSERGNKPPIPPKPRSLVSLSASSTVNAGKLGAEWTARDNATKDARQKASTNSERIFTICTESPGSFFKPGDRTCHALSASVTNPTSSEIKALQSYLNANYKPSRSSGELGGLTAVQLETENSCKQLEKAFGSSISCGFECLTRDQRIECSYILK